MVSTKRLSVAASPMSTVQLTAPSATQLSTKVAFSPTKSRVEPKYCESERVLCYEPDPTKVEVIYDAKILQVGKYFYSAFRPFQASGYLYQEVNNYQLYFVYFFLFRIEHAVGCIAILAAESKLVIHICYASNKSLTK